MSIKAELVGQEAVIQRLNSMGNRVKSELHNTVTRLSILLQRKVVSEKLSGQVLKRKTGTLAASIQFKIAESSTGVIGIVGSRVKEGRPLKYAAIHEYGFKGTVNVKEHLRTITQAFGKAISPVTFSVAQHQMKMNVPERSYLRSSLSEMEIKIREDLAAAVARGTKRT